MKSSAWIVLVAALLVGPLVGRAQTPPQAVSTTNGLRDEFGAALKGVSLAATNFGFTAVLGEIVQILIVTNDVPPPPDASGNPDPGTPVLFAGRVGDGLDPTMPPEARFSFSIPDRPNGARIVARVFNKSALQSASFYQDSQVFYVDTTFNYAFIPALTQTLTPLDSSDADGDGLIGSWEESLGGDPANPDSDGDGMSDFAEWRAGTELTNSLSLLLMVELQPLDAHRMGVTWDTVPGKEYQVEFRPGDLLTSTSPYADVSGVITGIAASATVTVTNDVSAIGHYRVRLVEP